MEKPNTPLRDIQVWCFDTPDKTHRETMVDEVVGIGSFLSTTSRSCRYDVARLRRFVTLRECVEWVVDWRYPADPRQVYVKKAMISDSEEDNGESVEYRVIGLFYVVWALQLFAINYDHRLNMNIVELPNGPYADSSSFSE